MKKIYLILIAAIAVTFVSCTDNNAVSDSIMPGNEAPIIDLPEGANQGEIMVKFKPEIATILDQTLTRAGRSVMTRSGISSMDEVLERIGTYKLERIFPVDKRNEERTRSAGLSLWYVIHFDETTDLEQVAKDLARVAEVAKVQFSQNIQRAYDPTKKPTLLDEKTRRVLAATRAGERGAPFFNDPGLYLQWGYINDGTLFNGIIDDKNQAVPSAVQGVDVGCGEAWKLCTGDPSIIVAVLDEGVMWDHPDLKANMWKNENEIFASKKDNDGNGYNGDLYGYNFVFDQGYITYDDANDTGHGTHVAGTIAAVNGNGDGVCGIAGGDANNSGVKIMSCQVFSGNYGATLYTEAKAIKYAADNGAVVLQCSWGYNSGRSNPALYTPGFTTDEQWLDNCPLEKEALDYFIHNAGSPNGVIDGGIVVFAGGNEYAAMAGYPGAYPDYISVAAVAADGTPSSYSNFGAGISISAPGGDSDYHKSEKGKVYSTVPPLMGGEYYGYMEGTSMACPHVSGVVALGLSYAAKLRRHFRAADFHQLVFESVSNNVESYFNETKLYWPNYESFGSGLPMQMEPANYANKMGRGLIDAGKLLGAIEGKGVEMTVPNMFVAVNGSSKINYTRYFKDGEKMTYSCALVDNTVATLTSTDNVNFTLKGLKIGSTKATVTASDGTKKDFYITVRKSNGWM